MICSNNLMIDLTDGVKLFYERSTDPFSKFIIDL